jgi:hypothetical protein
LYMAKPGQHFLRYIKPPGSPAEACKMDNSNSPTACSSKI